MTPSGKSYIVQGIAFVLALALLVELDFTWRIGGGGRSLNIGRMWLHGGSETEKKVSGVGEYEQA